MKSQHIPQRFNFFGFNAALSIFLINAIVVFEVVVFLLLNT